MDFAELEVALKPSLLPIHKKASFDTDWEIMAWARLSTELTVVDVLVAVDSAEVVGVSVVEVVAEYCSNNWRAIPVQCPLDSSRKSDFSVSFKTLANNLKEFNELGFLPVQINMLKLEGDGIGEKKCFWYRSCYSKSN